MRGLFVTGTDTDVGKTFISSLLLKSLRKQGHRVGAYKPACSGAVFQSSDESPIWEDQQVLSEALNHQYPPAWICPQCFLAPLAPPVAASQEKKKISEKLLLDGINIWDGEVDGVIVEGVGGWKCPLSESLTVENLAQQFGYPVLIVAAQKLGVINHTLLTIEAVRQAGLTVAGLILNQVAPGSSDFLASNIEQILKFSDLPFVAVTDYQHQDQLKCWETATSIDNWEIMDNPSSMVK